MEHLLINLMLLIMIAVIVLIFICILQEEGIYLSIHGVMLLFREKTIFGRCMLMVKGV